MPDHWLAAVRWTARAVAERGKAVECGRCREVSASSIWCSSCDTSYCRACLEVEKLELWDLAFECPACVVHESCHTEGWQARELELLELGGEWVKTRASALKPGTWEVYQRCMREMVLFMRDFGTIIFPVVGPAQERGMILFFQELKRNGTSWAKMAHFRSAIASASRARGFGDPWKEFPRLQELVSGLAREMRTPVIHKEGVTIKMVLKLIKHLEDEEKQHRKEGRHNWADTALRRQVTVLLVFAGVRRGAELFLNEKMTMGLRRSDIDLVHGSHVTLFLQSMKNDTTGKGTEVVLAWETASGLKIGETIMRLQERLYVCNVPMSGPLLCGTSQKKGESFILPQPGRAFRESNLLKTLLPRIYEECSAGSDLLSRFSFHSFRRGGASWAWRRGAEFALIKGHGAWRSDAGIAPYLHADLDGKLSVTRVM